MNSSSFTIHRCPDFFQNDFPNMELIHLESEDLFEYVSLFQQQQQNHYLSSLQLREMVIDKLLSNRNVLEQWFYFLKLAVDEDDLELYEEYKFALPLFKCPQSEAYNLAVEEGRFDSEDYQSLFFNKQCLDETRNKMLSSIFHGNDQCLIILGEILNIQFLVFYTLGNLVLIKNLSSKKGGNKICRFYEENGRIYLFKNK